MRIAPDVQEPPRLRSWGAKILPFAVLAFGLTAIYFGAVAAIRVPHDRLSADIPVAPHVWLKGLVGKKLRIPPRDSQGYPVPQGRRVYVVALGCLGCSVRSGLDRVFEKASIRPVLVLLTTKLSDVPDQLKGKPNDFLLLSDREGKIGPADLLNNAPQAALVSADGVIVTSPSPGEELADFLRRN